MLSDTAIEKRAEILRDSCDQIQEGRYLIRFTQEEKNDERKRFTDTSMEIAAIEDELAGIRAEYKARIKPLVEARGQCMDNLKAGGIYKTGEMYKFIDNEAGEVGFYDPNGVLIEERGLTKEERQRTVFQTMRTGTDD